MAEARSLADIKLDNAYKFGAGRYLQEAGALNLLGGEVARLGKKALVIAGPRAWAATEGKAEKSLKDAGVEFELSLYPDQNTYERAKEHALQALTTGCQVIVGIGGGRIMDQAKATAHFGRRPAHRGGAYLHCHLRGICPAERHVHCRGCLPGQPAL